MHVTVAACMSQWFNVRPVLISPITHAPVRLLASHRPLGNLGARGAAAASECRRPVRSAAARRSARARQPQDDAMTPAGPTDRTSAPSRASRCACVAGVLSHLGGAGRLLLLPRTRRAAERAPRPIDRHMAARCVKRGYRGLAPLRWRREERRPAEHLAASCSWIPRARGEPPGPRHARRPHCPYRERSECVSDRFSPMIEMVEHVCAVSKRRRGARAWQNFGEEGSGALRNEKIT